MIPLALLDQRNGYANVAVVLRSHCGDLGDEFSRIVHERGEHGVIQARYIAQLKAAKSEDLDRLRIVLVLWLPAQYEPVAQNNNCAYRREIKL